MRRIILWRLLFLLSVPFSHHLVSAQSVGKANQYFTEGNTKKALTEVNGVLHKSPQNLDALILRSRIHEHIGDLRKALSDLDAYVILEPNVPEILFMRGRLRFELEMYRLAIEDFEQLLEMDFGVTNYVFYRRAPGETGISGLSTLETMRAECQHYIGLSQLQLDKNGLAISSLLRAVTLDSGNTLYQVNLARAYEGLGKKDSALFWYQNVLISNPNEPLAATYMADLLMEDQEYETMTSYFSEVIHLHPDHLEAYKKRAWAYYMDGEYQKALDDYQYLLKNEPSSQYYITSGMCLTKLERYGEAEKLFLIILQQESENADALFNLGNLYFQWKKYELAKAQYRYLLNLQPTRTQAWYNLAMTYFELNNDSEGCTALYRSIQLGNQQGKDIYNRICNK
ncbi:MAG TPA: hypothetical protein DDY13_11345 [Cytophagales bacterium]|jgi:tetratricopeptide (TPR) repeat protein|nr:hypothetical protein [Cytophagales bacterium]